MTDPQTQGPLPKPDMANLLLLPGKDLAQAVQRWPKIQKLLEDIAHRSRGEITLPAIGERIVHEMMQLWLVLGKQEENFPLHAVGLTEIQVTASGQRRCWIWAYDGKGGGLPLQHLHAVEKWAEEVQKCSKICMKARRGIAHMLKGYQITGVFLERNLHPVMQAPEVPNGRRVIGQRNGPDVGQHAVQSNGALPEHGAEQRAEPVQRGRAPAIYWPEGSKLH